MLIGPMMSHRFAPEMTLPATATANRDSSAATDVVWVAALQSLVAVAFAGKVIYGAKRWLIIGPISIQPSEFVKIAYVLLSSQDALRIDHSLVAGGLHSPQRVGDVQLLPLVGAQAGVGQQEHRCGGRRCGGLR